MLIGMLLSACTIWTSHETININMILTEKPRLVQIRELIKEGSKYNKDFNSSLCDKCAGYFFDRRSEIPEDWQYQYRIALSVKMEYRYPLEIYISKCNKKEHNVIVPGFVTEQMDQYNILQLNLNIEKLKQLGYITTVPAKQQDLCIYIYRPYLGNFSKQTKYISNDIVLTADEISELVREYEALQ